jgi:hypothetical protein
MKYEVRYIVDNEERSQIVDVDNAADAAESVAQEHGNPGDSFELIQVHLLDDPETKGETLSEA